MAKYFITGGAGFLGINLTRYLLEKGHSIVSYDMAAEYEYPEKTDSRVTVVHGDIRDFPRLTEAMKDCGLVVHTAAALPLYSEQDIRTTDIDGTKNVLQAAYDKGITRFIQISSTAVYGIPDHHPLIGSGGNRYQLLDVYDLCDAVYRCATLVTAQE